MSEGSVSLLRRSDRFDFKLTEAVARPKSVYQTAQGMILQTGSKILGARSIATAIIGCVQATF